MAVYYYTYNMYVYKEMDPLFEITVSLCALHPCLSSFSDMYRFERRKISLKIHAPSLSAYDVIQAKDAVKQAGNCAVTIMTSLWEHDHFIVLLVVFFNVKVCSDNNFFHLRTYK